jgi:cystathionine beta-lyase
VRLATRCVFPSHLDGGSDPHAAVAPPIYQTATFRQPTAVEFGEYDYSRTANPTRALVEQQLAGLEGGRHGLAFASGMAALAAVTRLVAAGEEIVAGDDLYGGTTRLLAQVAPRQGIRVRWAPAGDPEALAAAIGRQTRLVLVETPTNPLLQVVDVAAAARAAHAAGALLAVDNSLLSPVLQRPLGDGADLVVHSATKALSGHSDVTAGAVVTDDPDLHRRLAFHQNAEGAGLAPFDAWLLLRGTKTLALRVERQCASAERLARFLAGHPRVERVFYPGLTEHPGHLVQRRQASGGGPVVSFTTGDPDRSRRLVEALGLFTIAVSFGSVHSTASLPRRMSHASVPPDLAARLAPPPDLVRLSIGVEDCDDLVEDLEGALGSL